MQGIAEPLLGLGPLSPSLQRETRWSEEQAEGSKGPRSRSPEIPGLGPAPEVLTHPVSPEPGLRLLSSSLP